MVQEVQVQTERIINMYDEKFEQEKEVMKLECMKELRSDKEKDLY